MLPVGRGGLSDLLLLGQRAVPRPPTEEEEGECRMRRPCDVEDDMPAKFCPEAKMLFWCTLRSSPR